MVSTRDHAVSVLDSTAIGAAIHVFDDVLGDAASYRAMALAQPFGDMPAGDEMFHGIAMAPDDRLTQVIRQVWRSDVRTTLSFFRKSPCGQHEPNFIHEDSMMGAWTALLYLNPDPPVGDGTSFYRHRDTGRVSGIFDPSTASDLSQWERWRHVDARFGRLLIFQSDYFHSRGLIENYGTGDSSRLVQVAFGAFAPVQAGTTIREAVEADVPAIVAMAERFVASTSYAGFIALNPDRMIGLTRRVIESDESVCLVAESHSVVVGMLAMHAFEHPMSGERVASELVWWMEPNARGAGMRLLRAAERWARDQGAAVITMVAPTAEVGSLYQRLGYAPVEVSWQRRI